MDLRFKDDPNDHPVSQTGALFHLPHRRNPHFTGRDSLLEELAHDLASQDLPRHVQALYGLGGVGKTQLAVELAHRLRERYAIVWWIRAEESAGIWIDYAALARASGLPLPRDASLDTIRHHLRRHLEGRSDFLLIFDNASSPAALKDFIPSPCRGAVIITSRNPNWGTVARSIPVHGLAREDSVAFLRRRTARLETDPSARKLAQALGDLPLALEQAAALIERSRISFADYLHRFEQHWGEMLAQQRPGGDYPDSVAMSWELSLRQVEEQNPSAIRLLNLLAFLSCDAVPRSLLAEHFQDLPEDLSLTIADRLAMDRAIGALSELSLIEVGEDTAATGADRQTLSLHRLVAALARDRLGEDDRRYFAGVAARLVGAAFTFDSANVATWPAAGEMLPHVLAAATHAQDTGVPVELTCGLLDQAGRYLNRFGRYDQAKDLLDRALALSRRAYGDESPRVSQVANNLGRVLARLGQGDLARQHFEWALAIDRNTYGDADPHVASVMNNYALVLQAAGQAEDARQQLETALLIFESTYGPEHPKVPTLLNNLGYMHLSAGDATSANDLFTRALGIAESSLGANHPTVAAILHNQGKALRALGHPLPARDALERALAINVAAYGEHHPEVARDCEALAGLLGPEQGRDYASRAAAIHQHLKTTPGTGQ